MYSKLASGLDLESGFLTPVWFYGQFKKVVYTIDVLMNLLRNPKKGQVTKVTVKVSQHKQKMIPVAL